METQFISKINSLLDSFMYEPNEKIPINAISLKEFLLMESVPMREKINIIVVLLSNLCRINTALNIALVDTFDNVMVELYRKKRYKLFRMEDKINFQHKVRIRYSPLFYDFLEKNEAKSLGGGDKDIRINLFDCCLFVSQLYSRILQDPKQRTRQWRPVFLLFDKIVMPVLMKHKAKDTIRIPAEFYVREKMTNIRIEFYNYLCRESKLANVVYEVIRKEQEIEQELIEKNKEGKKQIQDNDRKHRQDRRRNERRHDERRRDERRRDDRSHDDRKHTDRKHDYRSHEVRKHDRRHKKTHHNIKKRES